MRLKRSRIFAEEELIDIINHGYKIHNEVWDEYQNLEKSKSYNPEVHNSQFYKIVDGWLQLVENLLKDIFPTELELNYFFQRSSSSGVAYLNLNEDFGRLIYETVPKFIERLRRIFEVDLNRYTDMPIQNRLYIEDIDSFRNIRDINPAMVSHLLNNGYLDLSEDQIQLSFEQILNVSFHKKDWGGEINDLYTANLIVNGKRRATAFLLKGNGLKRNLLRIRDCGKNGDQIVRLFDSPAELFVIQFVGNVDEMVIKDVESKVEERKSKGKNAYYLIIDGQDTARILYAYGNLN